MSSSSGLSLSSSSSSALSWSSSSSAPVRIQVKSRLLPKGGLTLHRVPPAGLLPSARGGDHSKALIDDVVRMVKGGEIDRYLQYGWGLFVIQEEPNATLKAQLEATIEALMKEHDNYTIEKRSVMAACIAHADYVTYRDPKLRRWFETRPDACSVHYVAEAGNKLHADDYILKHFYLRLLHGQQDPRRDAVVELGQDVIRLDSLGLWRIEGELEIEAPFLSDISSKEEKILVLTGHRVWTSHLVLEKHPHWAPHAKAKVAEISKMKIADLTVDESTNRVVMGFDSSSSPLNAQADSLDGLRRVAEKFGIKQWVEQVDRYKGQRADTAKVRQQIQAIFEDQRVQAALARKDERERTRIIQQRNLFLQHLTTLPSPRTDEMKELKKAAMVRLKYLEAHPPPTIPFCSGCMEVDSEENRLHQLHDQPDGAQRIHTMHISCAKKWFSQAPSCPDCRVLIKEDGSVEQKERMEAVSTEQKEREAEVEVPTEQKEEARTLRSSSRKRGPPPTTEDEEKAPMTDD